MHTTLIGTLRLSVAVACGALAVAAPEAQAQLTEPVVMSGAVKHATDLLRRGQRDSAAMLLGTRVTEQPNDGHAWFLLGRIHLSDAQRWHRAGHPGETSSASQLLEFAGTSFEAAQELLTDSGAVFRVVVAMERATLRVEAAGWDSLATWRVPFEQLPLTPVLAEMGRNLLASCARNGVFLTDSSAVAAAAVWGIRIQGERSDVVLLRPDMYQVDSRYRARMAAVLGVDSARDLASALGSIARTRPVCLGPTVDSAIAPGLTWIPSQLLLATQAAGVDAPALTLFQFVRIGPTGSVGAGVARDVYDLAARRNRALCATLFARTDPLAPPTIPACPP